MISIKYRLYLFKAAIDLHAVLVATAQLRRNSWPFIFGYSWSHCADYDLQIDLLEISMIYEKYRKDDIAARMLETALDLWLKSGDEFSIIHLAAAAEEVLAGLLKCRRSEDESSAIRTAREKYILVLKEIHEKHGNCRTEKEIGDYLNVVRNSTKHHTPQRDSLEISTCLELEVNGAISRAIENYVQYFGFPTDKIVQYINQNLQRQEIQPTHYARHD